MWKYLGYIMALGTVICTDSAHARTGGASACPQAININDLKTIVATPVNSTVKWKDTRWTVLANPLYKEVITSGLTWPLGTMNNNGKLECQYGVAPNGSNEGKIIKLSTEFTGMAKTSR